MTGTSAIVNRLERSSPASKYITLPLALLGYLLVLLVNGAIPFLTAPTTAQLVWLSGFAGSISNGGLISPYAHNVGWPTPAIVSFGLSGAWPMAVVIRLGLNYVDAYTLVFALWLALAYWGARRMALALGNSSVVATLGGVLWLTLPLIWAHQTYSMLAIGFALLPTYLLPTLTRSFDARKPTAYARDCAILILLSVVAVFTDGYTFVFFVSAALVLLPGKALLKKPSDVKGVFGALLAWILAVGIAYASFRSYMGNTAFPAEEIPFFRTWGLDPVYLLRPPQGELWLADRLGFSTSRDPAFFFGDSSIWNTTFLLPLMLLAAVAFVLAPCRPLLAWLTLPIAIAALYLALGPSLKWNTTRGPDQIQMTYMPSDAGVLDLMSTPLFEHVPGLQNMRATYRWTGLFALACWLNILSILPHARRRAQPYASAALALVLIFGLPSLINQHQIYRHNREMMLQMDEALVRPLEQELNAGERLAVLPWGNDFAVNYLAARLDLRAFNVGGDKNFTAARPFWPAALRNSEMNSIDQLIDDRTLSLLLRDEADVVMLAFFDPLWDVHAWPPRDHRRGPMQNALEQLRNSHLVTIKVFPHYAIVRRSAGLNTDEAPRALDATTLSCLAPECLSFSVTDQSIGTQMGPFVDKHLRSAGRAGFLMFGPYQPMSAGRYQLEVYGETEHLVGGTLDLVDSDTIILPPTPLNNPSPGILFLGDVSLDKPARRLEVRISTAAGDQVSVLRYRLQKRSCEPPICLQNLEFHAESLTQGGRVQDGWLHTTGQRGFLIFGPYTALATGDYELEVLGDAKVADGARVQVASDQGNILHGQFALPHTAGGPFLLREQLKLTKNVKDAEVRIWVEPTDVVSIRGLRLHQVGSTQSP